jgi:hypothetical protein
MENLDRLISLREVGLRSEGIGPTEEWSPCPNDTFQRRHDRFWRIVAALLETEPGGYDDLPEYLTETASEQLADN